MAQFRLFRIFRLFRLFNVYLQIKLGSMNVVEQIKKPSKLDQQIARDSYDALASALKQVNSEQPEIEIEETREKIRIPLSALTLLEEILKAMSEGKMISVVPVAAEITTQAAAEMLGCSRPHLVKLLEEGKIEFTKVGKHRRITMDEVLKYRKQMKDRQKHNIIDIMNADEETGLYNS